VGLVAGAEEQAGLGLGGAEAVGEGVVGVAHLKEMDASKGVGERGFGFVASSTPRPIASWRSSVMTRPRTAKSKWKGSLTSSVKCSSAAPPWRPDSIVVEVMKPPWTIPLLVQPPAAESARTAAPMSGE